MKIDKSNKDSAHGNERKSIIDKKHETNLRKNGATYFQLGLFISLAVVYIVLQSSFKVAEKEIVKDTEILVDDTSYVADKFKVVEDESKKTIEKQKRKVVEIPKDPKVVDNDTEIKQAKEFINDAAPEKDPIDGSDIDYIDKEIDLTPIPYDKVEVVPVFPGCEALTSNDQRKTCLSEKIGRIIQKKFRSYLGEEYGLSGKHRIDVQFSVDKSGSITNIKVRGPHPVLEKEALRVINLLPEMIPGQQQGIPVEVVFQKPILLVW